ncbi:MAG: aspartate carbamoyltransferase catalytic subunit [Bacillota bacterium]|nr:aspartate carbamoyltransferase catalytic subunit [Bacillota bacterium]
MPWQRKDLLGLEELTAEEIELVLRTAEVFADVFERPLKKFPTLRGRTVVNLFYEPSTRTRTSFELAGKWLSADVINISSSSSSAAKGESLADTARTLEALGADAVVIRHSAAGAPHLLARTVKIPVLNAGDGAHEHPSQGLLDLFTIRQHKGKIAGLTVTIVGDLLHSRVARSDIWGLTKLGARVRVTGPATLVPPTFASLGVEVYRDLRPAVEGADVVIVLRLQRERQAGGLIPSLEEYAALFGLDAEKMSWLKPDALVMHPGPANLGVEITEEAALDPRSAIRDQVRNGVAVRMALLYLLVGGGEKDVPAVA